MKHNLADMSWMQAEEAFKRSEVAILPVGTLHGHGPTPIGIDYTSVQKIADEVGRKTGFVTLPVVPYGENDKQQYYPGSITINPHTLAQFYEDVFRSLHRNGIRKVLVLCGHGGNREALMQAARNVRDKGMTVAIQEWWNLLGMLHPEFHKKGCHIEELAVALALNGKDIADIKGKGYKGEWGDPPDHPIPTKNIFGENIKPLGFNSFVYKGGRLVIPIESWDLDVEGGTIVTRNEIDELYENGKKILDLVIDYVTDLAKEFERIEIKDALRSKD